VTNASSRTRTQPTTLEDELDAIVALLTLIKDTDGIKKITDPVVVAGIIALINMNLQQYRGIACGPANPIDVTLITDSTGIVKQATTPTIYNVTLAVINTEYSQALPANTRKFLVQCQDGTEFRLAFETGRVAAPVAPYLTIRANCIYWEDMVLTGVTIYVAGGTAGKVVEIVAWT